MGENARLNYFVGAARFVDFCGTLGVVKLKEPPGAMLRYDGRLTTPSACPHIVRLSWRS